MDTISQHQQRPNRAIVAGFCASAATALVLLFAHIVAKIVYYGTDQAITGALIDNSLTALAASNLYLAVGLHFLIGITLAWIYMKVRHLLPENSWTAALCFMMVPFLLSIFALFPLTGGGLFGMQYGGGLLPGLGSLILHAVYGVTMVGLYEKVDTLSYGGEQYGGAGRLPPARHKHAATGILYGAALGMTVAAAFWFLGGDAMLVPGLPLEYTYMSLIFFFSACGLLIGFWTGVPVRRRAGAH